MKRKSLRLLSMIVILTMLISILAGCGSGSSQANGSSTQNGSGDATTKIDHSGGEPVTITWATIAGFYTDWAEKLAETFTEKTGVKVQIVQMDLPTMYEKEVLDIVGGTSTYDIITWNYTWKGEWMSEGYMINLDEYIARDAEEVDIDDIPEALLSTCNKWQGSIYGLPYYQFTPGLVYRADLFEHPNEMAAFKQKYGYALDVPQTYDQFRDIAEFFTRKTGDTLGDKTLTHDFYGVGIQAGRYTNIFDDVNNIAWVFGGDSVLDDGTQGVTAPEFVKAVEFYCSLVPFAPEGSLSGQYDYVVGQLNSGIIAMTSLYLDQWANCIRTEDEIEGAEIQAAALPGGGICNAGAFSIGVAKTSKHIDESWEFVKYITGYEAQYEFAKSGGSTCRMSILNDLDLVKQNRRTMGHYPVLAEITRDAGEHWYTNFIWTTQAAKIFEDAPAWLSAAASGEMTIDAALKGFASSIDGFTGGKAVIYNEGVHKPEPGYDPYSYKFDKSMQIRKNDVS